MARQRTAGRSDMVAVVLRLAAIVRREFSDRMRGEQWAREANMRPGCFGVLRVVGAADHPVSQSEVAETTAIDASDVVDLVDRLEAAGYLRRSRDGHDRRRYALEVTAAGREAIQRYNRVARSVDEKVLVALNPAERTALRRLLERVVEPTSI